MRRSSPPPPAPPAVVHSRQSGERAGREAGRRRSTDSVHRGVWSGETDDNHGLEPAL